MTGNQLREARKRSSRTQVQAAARLGVSQTYLSLLEQGRRPLTNSFSKKAARYFGLDPVAVPIDKALWEVPSITNDRLASDLAALNYPGLPRRNTPARNPAEVLIAALAADDLESRLVEALPWLVLSYAALDWKATIMAAKVKDIQNRLGFVVSVARRLASSREGHKLAVFFAGIESVLDRSRLAKEDTLCHNSMTEAEKQWLRKNRPAEAEHWGLLTDLSPRTINHVD